MVVLQGARGVGHAVFRDVDGHVPVLAPDPVHHAAVSERRHKQPARARTEGVVWR